MGLKFEGQYYKKSRDAGPYVPPHIPTKKYIENYDSIRWDKDEPKEDKDGEEEGSKDP